MELIKPGTRIPFTRYRKIAVIFSTAVNLAVLIALFVKGPNLGVDFANLSSSKKSPFLTFAARSRPWA